MLDNYLKLILKAPVYDVAKETELEFADNLTNKFANNIWLKREDTQPSFSYKIRGAYSLITNLLYSKKSYRSCSGLRRKSCPRRKFIGKKVRVAGYYRNAKDYPRNKD